MTRVGVVVFPGSCDDRDAMRAVETMGAEPVALWHGDADLRGADAVLVPGGFSYGDYLRPGALASLSPVMTAVRAHADAGRPVLGVCNGFQVLTETALVPGVLRTNASMQFRFEDANLVVERESLQDGVLSSFSYPATQLRAPKECFEGFSQCDSVSRRNQQAIAAVLNDLVDALPEAPNCRLAARHRL